MRNEFSLMASYNSWMNKKVYAVAGELSPADLEADKGAFFGSVLRTLNHILVGDLIWLNRFAQHSSRPAALAELNAFPKPTALNEILFSDFGQLSSHRLALDALIERWAHALTDEELNGVLVYSSLKGMAASKHFASVVLHFFNHQTHHRGQVTTLLSQFGKDVGVTDLLAMLPNEAH